MNKSNKFSTTRTCISNNPSKWLSISTIYKRPTCFVFRIHNIHNRNINSWRLNPSKRRNNFKKNTNSSKNIKSRSRNNWASCKTQLISWKRKINKIFYLMKRIALILKTQSPSSINRLNFKCNPTCLKSNIMLNHWLYYHAFKFPCKNYGKS